MKFTAIFILVACLQVSARSYSQTVSLSVKNAPLDKVFKTIEKQTGYSFWFEYVLLKQTTNVDVDLKNASLPDALNVIFKNQPLSFEIIGKTIVVKEKTEPKNAEAVATPPLPTNVHGRIVNEKGEPVAGVDIAIKGGKVIGVTNDNGEFTLTNITDNVTLVFSAITIETFESKLNGRTELSLRATTKISQLQDVVVSKGYYTTTQRLNTGNVTKVTGETINKQPVGDFLMALEGQVAGVYINQASGIPGSSEVVRLRGQNSIANGNNPLYIIDGVPVTSSSLTYFGGALGNPSNNVNNNPVNGLSPFSSLNLSDIENITILKDADATAIYGSRGANGVILITTKKGKAGTTKIDVNVYSGAGKIANTVPLLNTQQYIEMRQEAYKNDGLAIPTNAWDINGTWNQNSYTDWEKLMIGGTARFTNAQISISGGNANTQFLVGGGYNTQTTVFPGDYKDQKASMHFNLNHTSLNHKFNIQLSAGYSQDKNKLPTTDFTSFIVLAPDAPAIYDANGNLNWANSTWTNPFGALTNDATAITDNVISNLNLSYEILPGLKIKSNFGYTHIQLNQTNITRGTSFNPVTVSANQRNLALQVNDLATWIIEPQVSYDKQLGKGKMNILLGSTFQENKNTGNAVSGSGFSSDALIANLGAAATFTENRFLYTQYRYQAFYGRVGYNWEDKYLLNLTSRYDGSSRFGPGKQFGVFGAAGIGWIFSKEKFITNNIPFLSFGKLRASYGTTGNDQLTDYQYLATYSAGSSTNTYQGVSGLSPTGLVNPDYRWEIVKKSEIGLDLGFLNDKILLNVSYYINRTGNQLVGYPLPGTAGITRVQYNLPAVVQNDGIEFSLDTRNIQTKKFTWSSSFNISAPRNKLVSYPNLAGSSYAQTYAIGAPLFVKRLVHYTGVDPQTGLYTTQDIDKDGNTLSNGDYQFTKSITQSYYGGFLNSFAYKGFQLDIFFQFVKQTGYNYLNAFNPSFATSLINFNKPVYILDRWQKPGDITNTQKFSTTSGAVIYSFSDGIIQDDSFIRLKNISLSYNLPQAWQSKLHLQNARVYLQGQNLFTLTKYQGLDPETQNLSLPPLRMIIAGVQLGF